MCRVDMDFSEDKNLNLAIYNIIVNHGYEEFTENSIIDTLKSYKGVPEESKLKKNVRSFIDYWVEEEILQKHWNSYSLSS